MPLATGNKIAVLRNVFCLGEHLVELYAARNEITAADMRGMHKLAVLDLADNRCLACWAALLFLAACEAVDVHRNSTGPGGGGFAS